MSAGLTSKEIIRIASNYIDMLSDSVEGEDIWYMTDELLSKICSEAKIENTVPFKKVKELVERFYMPDQGIPSKSIGKYCRALAVLVEEQKNKQATPIFRYITEETIWKIADKYQDAAGEISEENIVHFALDILTLTINSLEV